MTEQITPNSSVLEELIHVLHKLTAVIDGLASQEEQKAQAASLGNHHLITGFLNQEQAQILKLRGLEQKRMQLTDRLGWKDLTFRQILDQADEQQTFLLSPAFEDLNRQVKRLKAAKDAADKVIRVRMRELDSAIAAMQGRLPEDVEASRKSVPPHFQDKYV